MPNNRNNSGKRGMSQQRDPIGDETRRSPIVVWIFVAGVAAGLLLYLAFGGTSGGEDHPAVGQPLEFVDLEPLTGGGQALDAQSLIGKVTLINFFGTWCPPCLVEFPHLVALSRRYADKPDFQFIPVSCSPGGLETDVAALRSETLEYLTQRGFELPTWVDRRGTSRQFVMSVMGRFGYPTTLLIDREGIIQGIWLGAPPNVERVIGDRLDEVIRKK